MHQPFAATLKHWRQRRRMSQLDLACVADVSARHIAFLETGRSKPSRTMVVQLSEALDIPRAARNELLTAAGFAPLYRRRNIADADMLHVRAALDWMLERHAPYPAFAIDRHWNLMALNEPARMLFKPFGFGAADSLIDALTGNMAFRNALENWPTVAHYMIKRLRTESVYLGGDEILDRGVRSLSAGLAHATELDDEQLLPAVVPARFRLGGGLLSFFSTITQFGTAEDMALTDLRIEFFFPTDAETKAALTSAFAPKQ
jgi:transcriptional regulator with XRE-family HTH domain